MITATVTGEATASNVNNDADVNTSSSTNTNTNTNNGRNFKMGMEFGKLISEKIKKNLMKRKKTTKKATDDQNAKRVKGSFLVDSLISSLNLLPVPK